MRLMCNRCGKPVSSEVPEETVVRAWIECPECLDQKAHKPVMPEPLNHCGHENVHMDQSDHKIHCDDCGQRIG
jgi:DNA-directed RNA polymerase subunit RPC12/RpoP